MHQLSGGRPYDAQTGAPQPKAEADIIIRERHGFVEAADHSEHFGADRHASSCNARDVPLQVRASKITEAASRQPMTRMTRYAADAEPQDNAGMLNCTVRIIKLETCRRDLGQ